MTDNKKDDTVYWGNIWGWKVSLFGLGLLLLMLGLMGMRKCQLNQTGTKKELKTEKIHE